MTLNTHLAVTTPGLDPKEALNYLLTLLGATEEQKALATERDPWSGNPSTDRMITMPAGIGLPAWCDVQFNLQGDLLSIDEDDTYDAEEAYRTLKEAEAADWAIDCLTYAPKAYVILTFDTGYSYRAPNGAGCGDLHAWLIREVGDWLTTSGHTFDWYDESGYGWGPDRAYNEELNFWGTLGDPDFGDPESTIPVPTTDMRAEYLNTILKLIREDEDPDVW